MAEGHEPTAPFLAKPCVGPRRSGSEPLDRSSAARPPKSRHRNARLDRRGQQPLELDEVAEGLVDLDALDDADLVTADLRRRKPPGRLLVFLAQTVEELEAGSDARSGAASSGKYRSSGRRSRRAGFSLPSPGSCAGRIPCAVSIHGEFESGSRPCRDRAGTVPASFPNRRPGAARGPRGRARNEGGDHAGGAPAERVLAPAPLPRAPIASPRMRVRRCRPGRTT